MFTVFVRRKGRGGYSQSKSTPLATKQDVKRWIKQSPMISANTPITVTNLKSNKHITAPSWKFY